MTDKGPVPYKNAAFDWDNCVIEKTKKAVQIYRLPSNPSKCYRFHIEKRETKKKKNAIRRNDLLPWVHYIEKGHRMQRQNGSTNGYKLLKMEPVDGVNSLIHRLRDRPNMCYIFVKSYQGRERQARVQCTGCQTSKPIYGKNTYKINKHGFIDDPEGQHNPCCKPRSLKELMSNARYVNTEKAVEYISGDNATFMDSEEEDPEKDQVWKSELVGTSMLSFLYDVPKTKMVYQFVLKESDDHSILVCKTCEKSNSPPSGTLNEWKSDGFSIEKNPRIGHLPGCDPIQRSSLKAANTETLEDGKDNPNRKYEFPLLKRQKRQDYYVLYHINANQCYRFHGEQHVRVF